MPQPLLSDGNIPDAEYEDVIEPWAIALGELEKRVDALEDKAANAKHDAVVTVLNLLGQSLKEVATGRFDLDTAPAHTPTAPQFDPRWDAWKSKLGHGTAPARVIDSLLTHGGLTRVQLRQAGEMGWSTLDTATTRLKNLGLIEKVGDKWNLKQL
jgi:hypothetical protein